MVKEGHKLDMKSEENDSQICAVKTLEKPGKAKNSVRMSKLYGGNSFRIWYDRLAQNSYQPANSGQEESSIHCRNIPYSLAFEVFQGGLLNAIEWLMHASN